MIPYFIVFACVSILGFAVDFSKSKYIRAPLYFLILLSFLSLYFYRDYGIGTDTLNYIPIFQAIIDSNSIVDYSLDYEVEIGFSAVVYFFSLFSNNYFYLFSCLTAIIYINIIISLSKFKVSFALFLPSLFCVFQIYFYSFNILRQAIAISFVMLATSYLIKNRNKTFFLYCFIGFLFHYTSIFSFLFYFVYKFRFIIVKFWYLSVLGILFLLGFVFNYIIGNFDKYSAYNVSDSITQSSGILISIFYISLFLISVFLKRFISIMNSEFSFFLALYCFYISLIIFFIVSPFLNQGMVRISLYFLWPSIFLILILIKNMYNSYMRYVISCFYYLFLVFFTFYFLSNAGYEIIPYRFR